jgi:hypothetical protein
MSWSVAKQKASRYEELVRALGQHPAATEEEFLRQRSETATWRETTEEAEARAERSQRGRVEFAQGRREYDQLQLKSMG